MKVTTAITLINSLVYKPDWKITAEDHTLRFENSIKVTFVYPARNSDRDQATDGYPNEIMGGARATFPIIIDPDCTEESLFRKVSNMIMKIEEHEMREFLRVQPTNWAPFHPHRIDGMRRWRNTDQCGDDELLPDLVFGIA